MSVRVFIYISILMLLSMISCRRTHTLKEKAEEIKRPSDTLISDTTGPLPEAIVKEPIRETETCEDTVYLHSYGIQTWYDSIYSHDYTAFLSVWVDTTDLIIDTVRSARGNRIVIGYNHHYNIEFRKKDTYWFSLHFDKKNDLFDLLGETDAWLESNLNVFENLIYNRKHNAFIIEFNISTRDQVSSLYYIIFNTDGKIEHIGTANSWGGGGADGDPFLTNNNKMYISCSEVYNFITGTAMSLSEYAALARYQTEPGIDNYYIQTHAIRNLGNNYFLVVFNRVHDRPVKNALILNTDTLLVGRFRYYGFIEEMDALLLFYELPSKERSFLFDTSRDVLIILNNTRGLVERELNLSEIQEINGDKLPSDSFELIDFGFYASVYFYFADKDTVVYKSSTYLREQKAEN